METGCFGETELCDTLGEGDFAFGLRTASEVGQSNKGMFISSVFSSVSDAAELEGVAGLGVGLGGSGGRAVLRGQRSSSQRRGHLPAAGGADSAKSDVSE